METEENDKKKQKVCKGWDTPNYIFPEEVWRIISTFFDGACGYRTSPKLMLNLSHVCKDLYQMSMFSKFFNMHRFYYERDDIPPACYSIKHLHLDKGYCIPKVKYPSIENLYVESNKFQPWMLESFPNLRKFEVTSTHQLVWLKVDFGLLENVEYMKVPNLDCICEQDWPKLKKLKEIRTGKLDLPEAGTGWALDVLEKLVISDTKKWEESDLMVFSNIAWLEMGIHTKFHFGEFKVVKWTRLRKLDLHSCHSGHQRVEKFFSPFVLALPKTLEELSLRDIKIVGACDEKMSHSPYLPLLTSFSSVYGCDTFGDIFEWEFILKISSCLEKIHIEGANITNAENSKGLIVPPSVKIYTLEKCTCNGHKDFRATQILQSGTPNEK